VNHVICLTVRSEQFLVELFLYFYFLLCSLLCVFRSMRSDQMVSSSESIETTRS
jgi:hypothetical protein